ncbi:MAG: hypothetical protein Q7O66_17810 [Dehalococcoidia bacterium]|nr:hypothetical protein [Dehalococcoidia bacterium]
MLRASVAAEKVGVRSVSLIMSAFMAQARPVAGSLGVGNLPLAEYKGVHGLDSAEEFRDKVATQVVNQIVEGLASYVEVAAPAKDPGPRDIVFRGSLTEVQGHFHYNTWTDGLPVIPPTIEKVEEFLRFTDRFPDEVIGTLLPARCEATVWNVAVNGVMAGCRPEYMPVLLAIVEAMAEPEWRIEDAGSTPAWEPLVIVNGPIVKELDFNYESGTMRVGRQSNTSIGRFARLYMRNVAGLRAGRDETMEKGVIGTTFSVVLAENEDAVGEIGWKPLSVEQGFAAGQSVVSVQSVLFNSLILLDTRMDGAAELVRRIARAWGQGDIAYWSPAGMYYDKWFPLLVVTPAVAKIFARDGWTKDDIKQYLYENCKTTAREAEDGPGIRGTGYSLCQLVEEGKLPREYCASADPERLVPVFRRPETIAVVVSGDPGVGRARGYTNNHEQGARVSKIVKLPVRWKELLDEDRR